MENCKIICSECVYKNRLGEESPRRGDSYTHLQHMILWRTVRNLGNNKTTILSFVKLYEYGDVHVMCIESAHVCYDAPSYDSPRLEALPHTVLERTYG